MRRGNGGGTAVRACCTGKRQGVLGGNRSFLIPADTKGGADDNDSTHHTRPSLEALTSEGEVLQGRRLTQKAA